MHSRWPVSAVNYTVKFQSRHIITLCHSTIPVACQRMITSAHHNAAIWLFQPQLSEHALSLCMFPVVCHWAGSISALTSHTCSTHQRQSCSHLFTWVMNHKLLIGSTLHPQTHVVFSSIYLTSYTIIATDIGKECRLKVYSCVAVSGMLSSS